LEDANTAGTSRQPIHAPNADTQDREGGIQMGEVLIRYKIMPEGPDTDLEKISEAFAGYVPEHGRVSNSEIKPAFFGLNMGICAKGEYQLRQPGLVVDHGCHQNRVP